MKRRVAMENDEGGEEETLGRLLSRYGREAEGYPVKGEDEARGVVAEALIRDAARRAARPGFLWARPLPCALAMSLALNAIAAIASPAFYEAIALALVAGAGP
jgi:hypothetical protein